MRKYEIMYIIRPTVEEEKRKNLIAELNEIFTSRGTKEVSTNIWGMRDLAYEIQKYRKGFYVLLNLECSQEAKTEFERVVKIKEDVIRHIVLRDER